MLISIFIEIALEYLNILETHSCPRLDNFENHVDYLHLFALSQLIWPFRLFKGNSLTNSQIQ